MPDRFSSQDVIALTGVTARQLQWWDERGVIKPARGPSPHVFHAKRHGHGGHLRVAAQRLLVAGSPQGYALPEREFGKGLAEIVGRNSDVHLLTDGKRLYLETSARQIVDILKNSSQPILGVCLSDAVRQVRAEVVARKASTSVIASAERRRARRVS